MLTRATGCAGRESDGALANAGALVNASVAATPNSAGAAAPGRRCLKRVRALLVGLPKGLLTSRSRSSGRPRAQCMVVHKVQKPSERLASRKRKHKAAMVTTN